MNQSNFIQQTIKLILVVLLGCSTLRVVTQPTNTGALPSSTPTTSPTQTPASSGKHIAFVSNRDSNYEIYMMKVDGSEQINLTNHEADDYWPTMSKDGAKIVFVSDRNEPNPDTCQYECNSDLYVIDIDGSDLARLTDAPGREMFPVWSPDGTQIAFNSSRESGFDLFVMKADGSQMINPAGHSGIDLYPTWLPDGSIVFLSLRDGSCQFFKVNTDGSDLAMLESGLPSSANETGEIAWMMTEDYHFYFYFGGNLSTIRPFQDSNAALGEFPAWSPDGTQIVFHSERDDNREIYIVDANLSNMTLLQ